MIKKRSTRSHFRGTRSSPSPRSRCWLQYESLEDRLALATLRVAAWNTLNMPDNPTQDVPYRTALQAIGNESVQGYAGAVDILALVETDPPSAARIRDVMNSLYPASNYQAIVSNVGSGGDATGFVYNSTTVSMMSSSNLTAGLTHPVLRSQFRPDGTFGESDFHIYATHLKSGTQTSDQVRREQEMTIIRADAAALGPGAAVLVAGDLNLQSSMEGAWTVATSPGSAQLHDLASAPGNWTNNPSFVRLHSQNTAFMLRRLDFQLSTDTFHDTVGLEYVAGSFHVFGNNGTHGLGNAITNGTGASPEVLQALLSASDHLPVLADYFVPPTERVALVESGNSTQVGEGGALDTYRVNLVMPPTSNVYLTISAPPELDLGSGPGMPVQLVFTPENAHIPQTVVVSALDNTDTEGTRPTSIHHSVASSDPTYHELPLPDVVAWILDDEAPFVVINEVDSDTLGIDTEEFIELYDGGMGGTALDGLVVVLFDGATDQSYAAFDLQGHVTDADGYFVLGNAAVAGAHYLLPDDVIQNGADAVALYWGNAAAYPVGSPITTSNLVDAIVYDTDDEDDPELLLLLDPGQAQINENANGLRNFESVSRLPNSGLRRNSQNLVAQSATPGKSNVIVTPQIYVTEPNGPTEVSEGGTQGIFTLALASLPDADVTIVIDPDDQLDLGAGPGSPVQRIFNPVTGVSPQIQMIAATDDTAVEGPHIGSIAFTVVSADAAYDGMTLADLSITIGDNDYPELIINEVDSDTPGFDTLEFIELYDGGVGNMPLHGLSVVLFNGGNDAMYAGYDLDGFYTDANGFFVLGNPLVPDADLIFPNNLLQNGPDAVALYIGDPADFPLVTTDDLLDALVYDTDDPDDFGLLVLHLPGQPQINESGEGDPTVVSMARVPDGGLPRVTTTYQTGKPTPGTRNSEPPTPSGDFNGDGLYDCLDVDALAAEIASASHAPDFDLTGDGLVDSLDLSAWLAEAGAVNLPSGAPYLPADANLDGVVDGSDFNLWNSNKFTLQPAWCKGDFTADGSIDGSDFGIWNVHKFSLPQIASRHSVMADWISYWNGEFTDQPPCISVYDAGFIQGVTVSEQLRTFQGSLFRADGHWNRLRRSLEIVGVPLPVAWQQLSDIVLRITTTNHSLLAPGDDLSVTVLVTPGTSASVVAPTTSGPSLVIHAQPIAFHQWAEKYTDGQRLIVSKIRQTSPDNWPPELKCRSRMHYYLADREARQRDAHARALLLDRDGFISEASTANIFAYSKTNECFGPLRSKTLPGVSLEVLREWIDDMGIPFHELDIPLESLCRADEVFLCSTSPCILPVVAIDGQPVGTGAPGPFYWQLLESWNRSVGIDIARQARDFAAR